MENVLDLAEMDKSEERRRKKHKHKHRRHRHKKAITINFDMPGVVHVIMNETVQRYLGCLVGEDIVSEKLWKKVSKEKIMEQIDMDEEDVSEDFLPFSKFRAEIKEMQQKELLIGYIPDDSRDYDEFYLCLSPTAEENIMGIVKEMEEEQQTRLTNSINKSVNPWTSRGSEREVDENIPRASRGYFRIELETKYPIMNPHVTFHLRLVQQARDGFMELKIPSRYAVPNISKKRIDNFAQAAPFKKNAEVQTDYPFPQNTWTQYKYECDYVEITKENKQLFIDFFKEIMDYLPDRLFMNYNMNLFVDDYKKLMSMAGMSQQRNVFVEKMSFKDIIRCKDKMISAVAWHPMWSGTVATAYANISPLWVDTVKRTANIGSPDDKLWESVHGQNPVLLWSFNDSLKPKLLLETNCAVHALAFCPHDENLLLGGCVNGQIVLWDIKNKLNKVEEVEILTTAQHKYRTLMFSMMKWMMNVKDLSVVPITAISNLTYSHLSNVTSIMWVHPLREVTRTGQLCETRKLTLQFATCSADGFIKFWDLKQKAVIRPGEYRPQRKSKRLKFRPPALTTDVSPFRILNRKLVPHYQLNVILPKTEKTAPLTFIQLPTDRIDYTQVDYDPDADFEFTKRLIFTPEFNEITNDEDLKSEFMVGTYGGSFVVGAWEGYEYSSGDVVCTECPKILSTGKYHDGPVLTAASHPFIKELILTVGGKVFAIWSGKLDNMPVFWRRSKQKYTYGSWRGNNPCSFSLSRSDGNREVWNLKFKCDTFYYELAYSGKAVFEGTSHPLKVTEETILGLADSQGNLRVITVKEEKVDLDENMMILNGILDATIARRKDFKTWQSKWVEKHASWILEQREAARLEALRIKEEQEAARRYEEEMKAQEAADAAKRSAMKARAPPGHFEEWAHEQYIGREQERMGNVLLAKKRMDRETLVKQQAPLKKLEAELEKKRHRQRTRLQKADQIFNETIKTLFPDILAERGSPRLSNILRMKSESFKRDYIGGYIELKAAMDEEIREHPYIYKFNWMEIVANSKQRKKLFDFSRQCSHKSRYEKEQLKKSAPSQDSENSAQSAHSHIVPSKSVEFTTDEVGSVTS